MAPTLRVWPQVRLILQESHTPKPVLLFRPVHRFLTLHATQRKENRQPKPNALHLPITPFHDPLRPLDGAIGAVTVHLAREDGGLSRNVRLRQLLGQVESENAAKAEKTKYPDLRHIRKVGEEGDGTPIVKFVTASELRAEDAARHKPTKSSANTDKRLELNWGLDQKGDLLHKLDRLREFLSEGRRVDVVLARKRGSRSVGEDEMKMLVTQIRDAALDIPGADEVKAAEGTIGSVLTLHFGVRSPMAAKKETLPSGPILPNKDEGKESKRELRRLKDEQRQRKAQEKQTALEQARTVKVADLVRGGQGLQ